MMYEAQNHWDTIYKTKTAVEVGWTQEVPYTSLEFIHSFNLDKTASIIDVGAGDSKLVDHLILEGFSNLTVLDISAEALEKAKLRLGEKAKTVNWVVSDVLDFKADRAYDLWHDRAAFHFLTSPDQIKAYLDLTANSVKSYLVLGTFSETGPDQCSGLRIKKYSADTLSNTFKNEFSKIKCITVDHITPFQTKQNYLFCSFKKHDPSKSSL